MRERARLDAFLAGALAASRAEVRRLLARGAVRVDGRAVSAAAKGESLAAGTCVAVEAFTPPAERRPLPTPELAFEVLAEGPGWLAVDKPAGMPVHPFTEDERGTALNAVVARHPEIVGVGEGGLRSGVVHRLDVDTSGVLLFATEARVWQELRGAFRRHRVDKRYRAVVLGALEGEGRLELDLVVAQHRPARVRVAAPEEANRSRRTRLLWRALERLDGATLLEVRPETGFLHQIRASLAELGHPVAGDPVYGPGPGEDPTGAPRQMLHAAFAGFGEMRAESPDPADFAALLARLR